MRSLLLVLAACGSTPAMSIDAPPVAADTWSSWAQGFAQTYCAATCHTTGGSGVRGGALDFTMYDKVFTNRAEIRCGVAATTLADCTGFPPAKQFPIAAPYPGDADRARLVAWVAGGAPE